MDDPYTCLEKALYSTKGEMLELRNEIVELQQAIMTLTSVIQELVG